MSDRRWDAVEVGVDEMFLGQREGETGGDGYSPFYDMGDVPRDLAERIAACLNACRGIPTEALTPDSVLESVMHLGDQVRQGVHLNGKYVAHIVIETENLMGDFERVVKDLRSRLPDIYGKTGEIHVGMSFQEKPSKVHQRPTEPAEKV